MRRWPNTAARTSLRRHVHNGGSGPRPGQVLHSGRRAPNGQLGGLHVGLRCTTPDRDGADGHTWPADQVPLAARRSLGGFGQRSTKRPGAWACGPPGTGERLLGPATLGETGIKARATVAGQEPERCAATLRAWQHRAIQPAVHRSAQVLDSQTRCEWLLPAGHPAGNVPSQETASTGR